MYVYIYVCVNRHRLLELHSCSLFCFQSSAFPFGANERNPWSFENQALSPKKPNTPKPSTLNPAAEPLDPPTPRSLLNPNLGPRTSLRVYRA